MNTTDLREMDCMTIAKHENRALLRGCASDAPHFSHENHAVRYFTFPLAVKRLSGREDVLRVLAPEEMIAGCGVERGTRIEAAGEIRSFNNRSGVGARLVLSLHARTLARAEGEDANDVILSGTLCRTPALRETPLGREICDLMLAVNRRCGRSDYLPCIAWGAVARKCAVLEVGESVRLHGRFQSRVYTKQTPEGSVERTAYEVSVMELETIS